MRRLSKKARREEFVSAARAIDAIVASVSDETLEIIVGRMTDLGRLSMPPISEWIDYCARAGKIDEARRSALKAKKLDALRAQDAASFDGAAPARVDPEAVHQLREDMRKIKPRDLAEAVLRRSRAKAQGRGR
jgi:hypothetical protein